MKTDKIVFLVIFYVALVLISIITVFTVDNYMHQHIMSMRSLFNNETSWVHLNDLLKIKLEETKANLLRYTNAYSYKEMENDERKASELMDDITDLLLILEKGGEYSGEMIKGVEDTRTVVFKRRYAEHSDSRYDRNILEMRTKLYELRTFTFTLRNLVIDSVIYKINNDSDKIIDIRKKISEAAYVMDDKFRDLDLIADKLYIKSVADENNAKAAMQETSAKYRNIKVLMNILITVTLTLVGFLMLLTVKRTVNTKDAVSKELNDVSKSLENVIAKPTEELELEIKIREQKERESHARAQFMTDVVESLAHPFYVIDADSYEIILANNAAYEVIGGRGTTCYELTHKTSSPCDGRDHPCPLHTVKETGAPTVVEHLHIVKGGEKRYFEVHGYPVKDLEGNVIQMIEYSLDITDKKDAEFALINLNSILEEKVVERTRKLEMEIKNREAAEERVKSREKHFRHLFANISDIVAILDKNMRITYLSPSVENIIDFTSDQLIGKSFEDLIHSRDRKIFEIWMRAITDQSNESRVIEFRIQKKSGSWINGEAIAKNMLDNEIINGIVINVRDISMRKRAEDEIRKLALVMEQNPNSILVTDLNAKIEYVNPAFEKISGYSPSEIIGKNPNIMKSDQTPKEVYDDLWDTLGKGKVWSGEFVNKKKNGELYIENAIIAPITNDRGEVINYLGMKENITELKKAREKAEENSKAKSMFLANMSHEIRTPLNGLMGFLELLNDTQLDLEQKEYVSTIRFSADALLGILNNVLDLSKIESGMLTIEKSDLDIGFNILNTAKTFYARAHADGITIYTYIDPEIPKHLIGDSLRLNQIVANLIGNAIKFTPPDGSIYVDAKLLKATRKTVKVMVSVKDTGVGIPEDKLDSIFDSFAQADASVTRKYGGTGLGLTITRNLLRLMGSDIIVESKEGEGSRFSFELSLHKQDKTSKTVQRIIDNRIYISGRKTLDLQNLLEKYLKSMNVSYEFAENMESISEINESILILNDLNTSPEDALKLAAKACRVVYIVTEKSKTRVKDSPENFRALSVPFTGHDILEALTGKSLEEGQIVEVVSGSEKFEGVVLVAEDNPVNTKLMEAMLSRLGVNVELAENGAVALEKCSSDKYDIVFMDINMPEMDGSTATKKLREYENSFYKERTIVIALTAHTAGEMQSRFLDSDFDGYLSKPVRMVDIEAVLEKYLSKYDGSAEEGNYDYLEASLAIGLPEDVIFKLLSSFIQSSEGELKSLKAAVDNNDFDQVNHIANSHKGAADNLRLIPVKVLFSGIEKSARLKNKDDIMKNIDKLNIEFDKIRSLIIGD